MLDHPPSTDPREVGPFRLDRIVGRGATATVWHGAHTPSGADVAVKVLTHPLWRSERRGGYFEREVRALARLDHPAIIRIHDYGWLTDGMAMGSTDLTGDCPFLVMDWYPQGTLAEVRADMSFDAVRAVLLALLDGLAFAHARGFVHRDLKPGNVLMSPNGPVCTDMGMVWSSTDEADHETGICGTPAYMAPEQAAGQSELFGPWTDLYALGCIAWERVTGRAPHQRASVEETVRACRQGTLPALRPRIALPDGFEAWMRRLLAHSPRSRYRFAADAARALRAISMGPGTPASARVARPRPAPVDGRASTVDLSALEVSAAPTLIGETPVAPDPAPASSAANAPDLPALDFDDDWRRVERPDPAPLSGCGRGLTRLRIPAMSGRIDARERVWQQLVNVAREGMPRVVCIDGASGIGKTRLADWLAYRAHELGYADTLSVRPRAHPFATSALWTTLLRGAVRPTITTDALTGHLARVSGLDVHRAALIAGRAIGTVEGDGADHDIGEPGAFEATLAAMAPLCAHRPLLFIVDDAHLDDVAMRFVNHALEAESALPVLYVVAMNRAGRGIDPLVRERLDGLVAASPIAPITLRPLAVDAMRDLISRRLVLDEQTRDMLARGARGNPLYAGIMLSHWLDDDALRETAHGDRLEEGRADHMPADLTAAWTLRLDGVLRRLSSAGQQALELGATLGRLLQRDLWAAACTAGGLDDPEHLLAPLLDADLISLGSDGRLALGHPMLGEALRARARRAERSRRWHSTCADVLQDAATRMGPVEPEQIARHLVAAGRFAEAMPHWFAAIETCRARGIIVRRRACVLAAARTGRAMRIARTSETWIRVVYEWARIVLRTYAPSGLRHARRVADLAKRGDDPITAARALQVLGIAHLQQGRLTASQSVLSEAADLARDAPDLIANTLVLECHIASHGTDLALAARLARRAAEAGAAVGDLHIQAAALNQEGEIARRRGEYDAAERAYREAARLHPRRDNQVISTANLALVQIERGEIDDARTQAEAVRWQARRLGTPLLVAIADLALLACAAHAADIEGWDRAWAAMKPIRTLRYVDPDIARVLEHAARRAHDPLPVRALAAAQLAIDVYRKTGQPERAQAIEAWAAAVTSGPAT